MMTRKVKIIRVIPVETYSRVVGYFQPVNNWNRGKQSEWNDRYEQDPDAITEHLKKSS